MDFKVHHISQNWIVDNINDVCLQRPHIRPKLMLTNHSQSYPTPSYSTSTIAAVISGPTQFAGLTRISQRTASYAWRRLRLELILNRLPWILPSSDERWQEEEEEKSFNHFIKWYGIILMIWRITHNCELKIKIEWKKYRMRRREADNDSNDKWMNEQTLNVTNNARVR